jgi:hypothetical protein
MDRWIFAVRLLFQWAVLGKQAAFCGLFLLLPLHSALGASATISSNLVSYSPGTTLTLSYSIDASGNVGTLADIYIAGIMPDGTILLFDSTQVWTTDLKPLIKNLALSNINAPGFLSAPLPDGLPSGIYQFYVVAVSANANAALSSNWLASNSISITYVASGTNIDSYIYFKRGSTVPQPATISFPDNSGSGTLLIDGKSIPGIFYTSGVAGSSCLGGGNGGVLTVCSAPADLPNTMLLCGPDPATGIGETLLYVILKDPDTHRVANNASNYLSALQSETRYLGGKVYRNCSGSFENSWIRNYPATNYYRWPDVFTTYSADYMTQLLKGAAIYSTPTAGNKYYEYVIIRSDATAFEIWH